MRTFVTQVRKPKSICQDILQQIKIVVPHTGMRNSTENEITYMDSERASRHGGNNISTRVQRCLREDVNEYCILMLQTNQILLLSALVEWYASSHVSHNIM
jgi:hypothetical protein